MKKPSLILVITLLTVGCASRGPDHEVSLLGDVYQGVDLYADLEKVDGEWQFTNISEYKNHNDGVIDHTEREVRLTDFSYLGDTDGTSGAECLTGFFGFSDGNCVQDFRTDLKFKAGHTNFGQMILAPVALPINQILVPLVGPSNGWPLDTYILPMPGDTVFDWDEYWSATDEAKQNDDFNQRLPDLYEDYVSLRSELEAYDYSSHLKSANYEAVRSSINSLIEEREKSFQQEAEKKLNVEVRDDSGLATISPQRDISNYVGVSAQVGPVADEYYSRLSTISRPNDLEKPRTMEGHVYGNINVMQEAIASLEREFIDVKNNNRSVADNHNESVVEVNENNSAVYKDFYNDVSSFAVDAVYDISSIKSKYPSYNISLTSEEDVRNSDLSEVSGDVTVVVESVDVDSLFMPGLGGGDQNVKFEMGDDFLRVTNYSGEFVTIDSLSLYYRNEILSVSGDNYRNFVQIPPGGSSTVSMSNLFDVDRLNTNHPNMTREKANSEMLKYGLALSYRGTGGMGSRTVQETRNFSLSELMD